MTAGKSLGVDEPPFWVVLAAFYASTLVPIGMVVYALWRLGA